MTRHTRYEGPRCWRGDEMRHRTDWIRVLQADEIAAIDRAVEATRGLEPTRITPNEFSVPQLERSIERWAHDLHHGRGFVLIRGLPIDRYDESGIARAYCGIGSHLGAPVSQNANGDLLGHVRDDGSDPNDPNVRLYRTRARQDFHTDGSDIIGLLCLKGAKRGGESKLASSTTVYNEVSRRRPDLAELMFEPFFWDRHGEEKAGELPYWKFPICVEKEGHLQTFFIGWYIRDAQRHADVPRLTPRQLELIELIETVANDPALHLDMTFEPGDIQLLKNSVILHAREAYEDWEAPEHRRHLLRLWLAADARVGNAALRGGIAKKTP